MGATWELPGLLLLGRLYILGVWRVRDNFVTNKLIERQGNTPRISIGLGGCLWGISTGASQSFQGASMEISRQN